MYRSTLLVILCLAVSAMASAATITAVINGKTVTLPAIEQNGKAFVDVVALSKAMGGTATYTPAQHKVVISTPTASSAASAGTAQLAGDNGELGKLYSLRKGNPLYFTLLSAEYTTEQVNIGERTYMPTASEKLLVLHFTVQNPQKTDLFVRFDSLRLMAVDAMDVNHAAADWGDEDSKGKLGIALKPAQKIKAYTVITVPAKGQIPKLMVQSSIDNDGPVLRYDLRDKVTLLKAPIADPADATGATALEIVTAAAKEKYPCGPFDMTLEQFTTTTETVDGVAPKKGESYLLATLRLKNDTPVPQNLRFDTFKPVLVSTDGEILRYGNMLFATTDRRVSQPVNPGDEMTIRLYFTIPKDVKPGTLTIRRGDGTTYKYQVE